ncbi:MAG: prolyl oligopeptidase family serine peptidase [Cyclobacteriaceae bacterium]
MNLRTFQLIAVVLFSTMPDCGHAQNQAKSNLTIEQIMQGPDFVGYLPSQVQWADDNHTIYFSWNPEKEKLDQLYKTNSTGQRPVKVELAERKSLPSSNKTYNREFSKYVYSKNGDLYLVNLAQKSTTQITNTIETENSPLFSGDGTRIFYTKGNNTYSWHISSGSTQQLTDFRSGKSEEENDAGSTTEEWLESDQLAHFQILRERKEKTELQKELSKLEEPKRPKKIYIGKKSISNIAPDPDGKYITYRLSEKGDNPKTEVMDYVVESGFTKNLDSRPKVGFETFTYEMALYDIERDTTFNVDTREIPGIYDKPTFLKDYHTGGGVFIEKYESPREVIIHSPVYSDEGRALVVVRSQDNKDRWIMELVLPSGRLKLLDRQRDEAWVGGPGISGWNMSNGNIGWLDNQNIWFQSEETGYSHLYSLDIDNGKKKALTKGAFEVLDAKLSRDKKNFYLTTNEEGPAEQHFYKLSVKGGKPEKATSSPGNHQVSLSPDETQLAILYSYSNKPWELFVMPNKRGSTPKRVTNSTTSQFNGYPWRDPEIVQFTASDGAKVAARLYKPENAPADSPAVIFVHGAGYLQNVHKWWSSYYREYMFHNFLVDNGYTVLDIDYRGSAGYGRDWRTGIYRHMGGKDLSDQIDGAKYLVDQHQIDRDKIGIYGGSYGGFITIMGLLNYPGTFQSGAALRSVTDWAHYNHGYTSNILNTPEEDSLAFRKSSPIYYAENLEDRLLMLHGMVDTNVQFQDVVRLSQRFIELGKDDWELAVFPMEGHGFIEPSSWTDEYKRIFKLFEETLKE